MVCSISSCFIKRPGPLPGPALSWLRSYPISILDVAGFEASWGREWPYAIVVMQQIISFKAKLITAQRGVKPGRCLHTQADLESGDSTSVPP